MSDLSVLGINYNILPSFTIAKFTCSDIKKTVTNYFNLLSDQLKERLKAPLPGPLAHEPLRAVPVQSGNFTFEHSLTPRIGSVLILLFEDNQTIKFPLIKRPIYVGTHSGQVSLPGGKSEIGEDYVKTALREAEEEVGVMQNQVRVLGRLSDFYVIPSNFLVTPVVGVLSTMVDFVPDPFEVERIIYGRLDDLLKKDAVKQTEIVAGGKYRMMAPHFEIESEIVWGATAMMLNEFRLLLQEIV